MMNRKSCSRFLRLAVAMTAALAVGVAAPSRAQSRASAPEAALQEAAKAIVSVIGLDSEYVVLPEGFTFQDANGDGKIQPGEKASGPITIRFVDDEGLQFAVFKAAAKYPELAYDMGVLIADYMARQEEGIDSRVLGKYAAAIIAGADLDNAQTIALLNALTSMYPKGVEISAAEMVDYVYEALALYTSAPTLASLRALPVFNYSAPPSIGTNVELNRQVAEELEKARQRFEASQEEDDGGGPPTPGPTPPDTGQVTPASNV